MSTGTSNSGVLAIKKKKKFIYNIHTRGNILHTSGMLEFWYCLLKVTYNETAPYKKHVCSPTLLGCGNMSLGDWCLMVPDMLWSHHHVLKCQRWQWAFSPSKMKPLCYLKTSGTCHPGKWSHVQEQKRPKLHCCTV